MGVKTLSQFDFMMFCQTAQYWRSIKGVSWQEMTYGDNYKTALASGEIILGISVPSDANWESSLVPRVAMWQLGWKIYVIILLRQLKNERVEKVCWDARGRVSIQSDW